MACSTAIAGGEMGAMHLARAGRPEFLGRIRQAEDDQIRDLPGPPTQVRRKIWPCLTGNALPMPLGTFCSKEGDGRRDRWPGLAAGPESLIERKIVLGIRQPRHVSPPIESCEIAPLRLSDKKTANASPQPARPLGSGQVGRFCVQGVACS